MRFKNWNYGYENSDLDQRSWLSFSLRVSFFGHLTDGTNYQVNFSKLILFPSYVSKLIVTLLLRFIYAYAATATQDAAYIIGGYWTQDIVAEFKNDQWFRAENLKRGRYDHGAITIGKKTMIIGGDERSDEM